MSTTVVLAKWAKGFVEVTDGTGEPRRTFFLDLGRVESEASATDTANAKLAELALPRRSMTNVVELPDGDPIPAIGDAVDAYDTTGTLTTQRLVGATFGADRNGWLEWSPVTGSPQEIVEKRLATTIQRLTQGTGGGRFGGASPTPDVASGLPTGQLRAPSFPEMSKDLIEVDEGPEFEVKDWTLLTWASLTLREPSVLGDVTCRLVMGGVELGNGTTLTLGVGETSTYTLLTDVLLQPGAKIYPEITEAGSGAEGLTYQVHTAPGLLVVN